MKISKKTAKEIAIDFIDRFNPQHWDGNGTQNSELNIVNYEAYDIGLPDDQMLYMQFENENIYDGKFRNRYIHNLSIYSPQYGTMETYSGTGIDDPNIIAKSIMDLCEKYDLSKDDWKRDIVKYLVRYDGNIDGECNTQEYNSIEDAEIAIKEERDSLIRDFFTDTRFDKSDNGIKVELWEIGGDMWASWERLWA